jgi:transposase
MQTRRERIQVRMMLLPPLEAFIPEDHPIRRLNKVVDLSFVHETVRGQYCQENGRPSIDPEVIIRLFLLQAIEGIEHVRDLIRQVHVNLAYRWFIGYDLDEKLPDHSTLSKALDRFGDKVFNDLFTKSIAQCKGSGLIEGRILHLDATTIRADIDRDRVGRPDSSDRDARYGYFPNKKLLPGYKQHTIADGKARVVLGLSVTPANCSEHDSALEVIDEAVNNLEAVPEAVCADGAYGSGENCRKLSERGIRLVSPPQKANNNVGDKYFTTESFKYDEKQDQFICPAGSTLKYIGRVKERPKQRRYAGLRSVCRKCKSKDKCTKTDRRQLKVSVNHAALIRLRADSRTESFKTLYRSRAPVIEGVFAEAKQWHSLGRAWRRGLSKMRVQCLLIAAVLNFKRLAAVSYIFYAINIAYISIVKAIFDDRNQSCHNFRNPERLNIKIPCPV